MIVASLTLATLVAAQAGAVVARVDGVAITADAVAHRVRALQYPRAPRPEQVVETLVVETLLAGEAGRLGLSRSPEVVAAVELQVRRAATEVMLASISAQAKPDDAQLRELFHSTGDFVSWESATFETRDDALAALKRIEKGSRFPDEAKRAVVATVHADPAAAPPVMRAQLPAPLAASLFAAAPGAIVGPVEMTTGWVVARVIRKQIGTDAEYAAKRESLVGYAREQVAGAARKHLIQQLKSSAKITVDEAFLRGLDGLRATSAQLDHVVATVNGAPIRYRDIYPSLRAVAGGGSGHMGGPTVKILLATKEAEERLVQAAAAERGYASDPSVKAQLPYFERMALAQAAAQRIQQSAPAPSEQEIAAHFGERAQAYGKPFEQVLPLVVADAAERKGSQALDARIRDLRKKASISIDRKALEASSGTR